VLERDAGSANRLLDGERLIDRLLAPTRIYVKSILRCHRERPFKGLAHITGGGLTENIPRVLPPGLGVELDSRAWPRPAVFDWLAAAGVAAAEMHRTFNCGIGMIVIVGHGEADAALERLRGAGEQAWIIGRVTEDANQSVHIG
jgi:phosphoribosylformylglycinamidine cyclo-ligase